jgi:hypothetical protein
MGDIKVPEEPEVPKEPINSRQNDEDSINIYMSNILKYRKEKQLNLQDLVYHNMLWNKLCYDQKRVISDNNWWGVIQTDWANTTAFILKYLGLSMTDIISGNYFKLNTYDNDTYPSDEYTAVEYKVYSIPDENNKLMNSFITIQFKNSKNKKEYITFKYFYKGLSLFTVIDKNEYHNIDPKYIRCKELCKEDVTLTNVLTHALSWWISVDKIFSYKYENRTFPARYDGLTDTIALYVSVNNSIINCITMRGLIRRLSADRKNNKKEIKYLLYYIMNSDKLVSIEQIEQKSPISLVPKFIDYLIKNNFNKDNLIDNFESKFLIDKTEYALYLDNIKKADEEKAAKAKAAADAAAEQAKKEAVAAA